MARLVRFEPPWPADPPKDPLDRLGFADPTDQDVVHLESSTGDVYLEQADQVERYRANFEQLQVVALPPNESTAFLAELTKKL